MNTTLTYLQNRFNVDVTQPVIQLTQINRTLIAQMFNELGFNTGAEVGVAEGNYSQILFEQIPGLQLSLVDVWATHPGFYEEKNLEQMYVDVQARLKNYNTNFVRKLSMEAVKEFADNSLDFVFIDAAHDFKNVADDICEWSKKVRPGGIVFGHDYKFHKMFLQKFENREPKVRHAVEVKIVADAYRDARGIAPWFQIYQEIKDPTFGRDNPCWMFVRQENDRV